MFMRSLLPSAMCVLSGCFAVILFSRGNVCKIIASDLKKIAHLRPTPLPLLSEVDIKRHSYSNHKASVRAPSLGRPLARDACGPSHARISIV